jgi:hypothetical protein
MTVLDYISTLLRLLSTGGPCLLACKEWSVACLLVRFLGPELFELSRLTGLLASLLAYMERKPRFEGTAHEM